MRQILDELSKKNLDEEEKTFKLAKWRLFTHEIITLMKNQLQGIVEANLEDTERVFDSEPLYDFMK